LILRKAARRRRRGIARRGLAALAMLPAGMFWRAVA